MPVPRSLRSTAPAVRIHLRGPVILMVLAATAIPVELKPPGSLGFSIQPADVLANIAGYVPIGIVLADLAPLRAILTAAAIALFAESSQFVMVHRDPSVVDVVANVIGAAIGTAIGVRWRLRTRVVLRTWMAMGAATIAGMLVAAVWATAGHALSPRGATAPGTLEAHWAFDEPDGGVALDSSGHDLRGEFRNEPRRVPGVGGGAVAFDGAKDYIDFDRPPAFRLVGDLTVSAWINARAHPVDDAAIVSTVNHVGFQFGEGYAVGFQLDTTIDRGPRTIGFKVGDVCGNLVVRYGSTPLRLDTWYHVAGVYDATARTMNVYLNGQPDDGFLRGTIRGARRSSREPLSVGRRSDLTGFEFAGAIDDVRIYSRALTGDEIAADMRATGGAAVRRTGPGFDSSVSDPTRRIGRDPECSWSAELEDARIPGAVGALGVLVCLACLALWPSRGPVPGLLVSVVGGLLLSRVATPTLPPLNLWLFPLTCLAGAASVIVSMGRSRDD